ncbi:hypothetical protein D5086_026631 [Populus alba]|uniref:Uncharacterized protein n=1 Tax=Populus alba TaxID=43335 RepID=A0ACC4B2E7_POPAL
MVLFATAEMFIGLHKLTNILSEAIAKLDDDCEKSTKERKEFKPLAIKQALNSRKKQQLKKSSPHEKYDSRGAAKETFALAIDVVPGEEQRIPKAITWEKEDGNMKMTSSDFPLRPGNSRGTCLKEESEDSIGTPGMLVTTDLLEDSINRIDYVYKPYK